MAMKFRPNRYQRFVPRSEEELAQQKKQSGAWKKGILPVGIRRKPRRRK